MEKDIKFENVTKAFGNNIILDKLNFEVHDGERLILLGPSGCGKSTTLRIIAGLEQITSGELYMNGILSNNISCGDRNVSMVFQNYALYPHMTVKDNIIYGLKANKMPKHEIDERLKTALSMLELEDYADRKPKELSGGQRQRVALARAVVKRSPYFLLDEPLSNLDAQLRMHARKELVKIHEKYGQTFVYVTHDQVEAMTIGQRIALLKDGKMQMIDTPNNIYNHPKNVFTAKFIGSPSMNISTVSYNSGKIVFGNQYFRLSDKWCHQLNMKESQNLYFGVRPEHIKLFNTYTENGLEAIVKYKEDYGNECGVYLDIAGQEVIAMCSSNVPACGETVYVKIDENRMHFFDGITEESLGYPEVIKNDDSVTDLIRKVV